MKTILTTTFAFALMVFVFNASLVEANENAGKKKHCKIFTFDENQNRVCKEYIWVENQMDDLNDPDQPDSERSVADSGNEGSTSSASAGNQ